ncbi:MAG: hypothetical protein RL235_58 [Chlamydiota bacterium]|jgi:tetratricopeptide (TPR) repeat protein
MLSQIDWSKTLRIKTDEIDDLRYIAYTYIQQGRYDVALNVFDALWVLTTPNAYDLQTLGALHLELGHNQKALELLDLALNQEPGHVLTQLNRAKALFSLGKQEQGLIQAGGLVASGDPAVASQASALILAFGTMR